MTATQTGSPPPELMSVRTTRGPAGTRLAVAGEIDCSTAPQLASAVDSALTVDPLPAADAPPAAVPAELVMDLTGVTFLDSAGLHVLVTAHRQAARLGVRLRVLAAGRAVLRPLQITGLTAMLGVEQVRPVDVA